MKDDENGWRTMLRKIELRAVIKFLTEQTQAQKIIHEEIVPIYQGSAPLLSTIQEWSSEFQRGRVSIQGTRASGQVSATIEDVKIVEKLVPVDARIIIKMLAEMTKLYVRIYLTILHGHLNLSDVSAKWVPRILRAPKKKVRIESCKEFWTYVVKIRLGFWTGLLPEIKLVFITMILRISRSLCNGIKLKFLLWLCSLRSYERNLSHSMRRRNLGHNILGLEAILII